MSVCWTPSRADHRYRDRQQRRRQAVTVREFWIVCVVAFLGGGCVGLMVACVFAYGIHRLVTP